MKRVISIEEMRHASRRHSAEGRSIGFVPTMGALHKGHMSLIEACRGEAGLTVASIFVNPTQFGPGEDFEAYPRDLDGDSALLDRAGVDILFTPEAADLYPEGHATTVQVEGLSRGLCGDFRPGHFTGVATVVAKLLSIVRPDLAFFGAKDWQQAVLIRKMASDLCLGTEIRICPTIREEDGLALSSRNAYLSSQQRRVAPEIHRALQEARAVSGRPGSTPGDLIQQVRGRLVSAGFDVQYVEVREARSLKPLERLSGEVLVAVAAFLGRTRLIDNLVFAVPEGE